MSSRETTYGTASFRAFMERRSISLGQCLLSFGHALVLILDGARITSLPVHAAFLYPLALPILLNHRLSSISSALIAKFRCLTKASLLSPVIGSCCVSSGQVVIADHDDLSDAYFRHRF